jgi:hypothetical protein
MFYTGVFLQNIVDDVLGEQHFLHIFYILYIKPSNHVLFGALRFKKSIGHLEYTEFRSSHKFCNIFDIIFITFLYCACYTQCCYLPAVWKYPHNIRERKESPHCRHGASQVVPMYVYINEHAYNCTKTTYNHCYHIDSVNSRHFLHL